MTDKIRHYQLATFESRMDALKQKAETRNTGEALTKAIDAFLGAENTIVATFTKPEWVKMMRIKNAISLPWHDILLQACMKAEVEIKKGLLEEGLSEIDIEKIFSGNAHQEHCAADIARARRPRNQEQMETTI